MSEIEKIKLYQNAGVKKQYDYIAITKNYNGKIRCTKRAVFEKVEQFKNKTLRIIEVCPFYPEFTAEKQIEIVKFLLAKDIFKCYQHYTSKAYIVLTDDVKDFICNKPFNEFLASYINYLWQSLSEEEKQQVKGILE